MRITPESNTNRWSWRLLSVLATLSLIATACKPVSSQDPYIHNLLATEDISVVALPDEPIVYPANQEDLNILCTILRGTYYSRAPRINEVLIAGTGDRRKVDSVNDNNGCEGVDARGLGVVPAYLLEQDRTP